MKSVESLPITNLRLDGGTQPRAALDFGAVEDYSEAMGAGAKFPAVTVFYDGTAYWLADGFHRVKAAFAAGFDTIECDLRQGALEDAQWFSLSANKSNGLRRTNEDKQRAVKAALMHELGAGLSDKQVARHCGVTPPTVAAWREKLGLSIKILKIAHRAVTRAGTTYQQNTANIGPRKARPRRPTKVVASDATSEPPARPSLDAIVRAVRLIGDCDAAMSDIAAQVASQPDHEEIVAAMEKANEFLELCAAQARTSGVFDSSTRCADAPGVTAGPDDGDPAISPPVA
jgi:transposase-like protein